jgi:hypothetical protein
MRYQTIEGETHIYPEGEETELEVLRAIVKASFELARPAGMGWLHFNDGQRMTNMFADQCISLPPKCGDMVIDMDYVQGRQCKTYVHKVDENHFILANHPYEIDRGLPNPMLDRAEALLTGIQQADQLVSTGDTYKGESLTLRLQEYGFTRKPNEEDWAFRQRVFPDLYQRDQIRASEFLMGSSLAEFNEIDKLLLFSLARSGELDRRELVQFAKGFAEDPLVTREKIRASQDR